MNISHPYKHKKNWLIWNNTVLDNIHLSDCNDTINSICLTNKNLNQCIDECKDECGAGYLIKFKNGNTICVPSRTDTHPSLNPVYRLRNKNIYPEFDDVQISTFVNTQKNPFPPNQANVVFYKDIITIKNTINDMFISTSNKNPKLIYMDKTKQLNIQLIPSQTFLAQISEFIPLKFGDFFQISIPGTSLVAKISQNITNFIEWQSSDESVYGNDFSFHIIPLNNQKKNRDIVTFQDTFQIIYSNHSIVVFDLIQNKLKILYTNIDNIKSNPNLISSFQFVSKMIGYYCENNKCKSVPIKNIKDTTYNNIPVTRNPNCWNLCNTTNLYSTATNSKKSLIFKIISMIFLFILSIIILTYIFKLF